MVAAAIVGGAIVGGVASNMAAGSAEDAANTAANAQRDSTTQSLDLQRDQFAQIQKLLAPYVAAGLPALNGQKNILGLNGNDAQQAEFNNIQNGAQFKTLVQQGENALLQNASATGGLRGGNLESALMQFRPELLNQLVQQQYANYGGLVGVGQASATGQANLQQNNANTAIGLLQTQGAIGAGNALAIGNAKANMYNGVGSAFGTAASYYGGGGGYGGYGGGGYWGEPSSVDTSTLY